MADLSTSWLPGASYYRPDGVTSFKVSTAESPTHYYPLGNTRDAKVSITPEQKADTLGRPFVYGLLCEGTIPSIQAGPTEIKLIDNLITSAPLGYKIGLTDGLSIATTTLLSLKWKLICDGDANDFRRIEYMVRGFIKTSEFDALVTSSPPADGTPATSDILYGLATGPILADQVPNGLSKVEIQVQGDSTWADFGDFKDGKYTFECVGDDGGGGRRFYRTTGIKFTFDATGNESDDAKLNLFDTIHTSSLNLRLTHMDGAILTLTYANVGTYMKLDVSGNADKVRNIALHSEGIIPITDPATFSTTWNALWS